MNVSKTCTTFDSKTVIPAFAGIQVFMRVDSRLRGNDNRTPWGK